MSKNWSGGVKSQRRFDDWHYLDKLPARVKLVLWDAVIPWSAGGTLAQYRRLLRAGYPEREAIEMIVSWIRRGDESACIDKQAHKLWNGNPPMLSAPHTTQRSNHTVWY